MNSNVPIQRTPLRTAVGNGLNPGAQKDDVPLLRQYWRMIVRRRYVIGGAVVVALLAGLLITLLMTPQYTAVATIEIARESNKITDIQGVERESNVADQEFYQTQYGLLRSRSLAERAAAQLRIVDDPKFYERFGFSSKRPEFELVNGKFRASGRADRQRAAGEVLLKHLSLSPTRMSRLVDISFTSPDAEFSQRVVNAWASNFIQETLARRYQATSYARSFLETRLAQLKAKLEESERNLVGYASSQRIINLPSETDASGRRSERSIDADDLIALNAALSQAIADRVQLQARYEQTTRSGANQEALQNQAINSLRQKRAELAAEYQRILTQFEPGYPAAQAVAAQLKQLDTSIAREEGRVSSSVATNYRAAVERERVLGARVAELKNDMLDLRRRSIQYNIYERDVDTNRQLYDGLLQRYKEIGVAGGVGVNNISIVDGADIPTRPSSPRLMLNLLVSALAGLMVGGVIAFALEQTDEAIADPSEVEKALGLPLLGVVPKLSEGEPREALLDRKSELVDAYLSVQTNLAFTTDHGAPRTLAVTSTRPGEGKSTTSLSLATMLARSHKRVVLVDGDMRSPSIHHLAGVPLEPGLSNFLAGSDDVDTLLSPYTELGVMVVPAGPLPPNAAELLTGERMAKMLELLLERFDHVIIDSPPVMGLADAPLIASRVEGTVYVIESHGIRTSQVRTALARLDSANAHIIGGVLSKFEASKAQLGFGYEYGYGYGREDSRKRS
jgi:capsular exopolysaccharide synthesis family protein